MFAVVDHKLAPVYALPGIIHQTVGGKAQGLATLEVWQQTIAAGCATPVHRHDCEEVIVILSGAGTCMVDGQTTAFGPNSTLVIGRDATHQIINTSTVDMRLIAALGMSPVRICQADGSPLPVPWEAR